VAPVTFPTTAEDTIPVQTTRSRSDKRNRFYVILFYAQSILHRKGQVRGSWFVVRLIA
jgi:hypothetical protein